VLVHKAAVTGGDRPEPWWPSPRQWLSEGLRRGVCLGAFHGVIVVQFALDGSSADSSVVWFPAVVGGLLGTIGGAVLAVLCIGIGLSPQLRSRGPNVMAAGVVVSATAVVALAIADPGDLGAIAYFLLIPAVIGIVSLAAYPIRERRIQRAEADPTALR